MADEIADKLEDGVPLVVNTDLSGGPGIHWITLFRMGPKTLIFDPLGPGNKRNNDAVIREQIQRTGSTGELVALRVQAKKSTHCGFFALAAAKLGLDALPMIFRNVDGPQKRGPQKRAPITALGNVKQLIRMFGFRD